MGEVDALGVEIERKFLVAAQDWRAGAAGTAIRQGYLSTEPGRTVRVRIKGESAYLTIKGKSVGPVRPEYEYEVPVPDAEELLALCDGLIVEKIRHRIAHAGMIWEVDVFAGDNAGLVVAEIELAAADQSVELPAWVGREVTDEPRYTNSNLARNPYSNW